MRLLRLRLANWAGVAASEVRFAPEGVTIVEGPNESGKTSLLTALDLLFDEYDSSKKEVVRATKPVHRDEGPEVEAELRTGPYLLVYRKRFLKRAETSLTVRAPRPESHTGREAHERAQAILAETLDLDLWKALRVGQGEGLGALNVEDAAWLSTALERAAGGTPGGERERTLLEAAHEEYLRSWTEGGKLVRPVQELVDRVPVVEGEVTRLRDDLRVLEVDVERAATLAREVAGLAAALVELRRLAQEHAQALKEVEALRLAKVSSERAQAEKLQALNLAQSAQDERLRVAQEAAEAQFDVAGQAARLAAEAPALAVLARAREDLSAQLAAAEGALREAQERARLAEGDVRFRRAEIDLRLLTERLQRIERAEVDAREAASFLARAKVNEASLRTLRTAHESLLGVQARAAAATTTIHLSARAPVRLDIDGVPTELAREEARTLPVSGRARLEIRDLVVEVRAGASPAGLAQELAEQREAFAALCVAAGVAGVEEAAAALEQRKEAQARLKARDTIMKDNLGDLTRERLEHKIAGLSPLVASWPRERPLLPPLAADFETARTQESAEKENVQRLQQHLAGVRTQFEAARSRHDEAASLRSAAEGRLALLRDQHIGRQRRLDEARAAVPDAQLLDRLTAGQAALQQAVADVAKAERALAAAGADLRETLARNALESVASADARLRAAQQEQAAVLGRLEAGGERGLGEALAQREAALDHARRVRTSREAQAAASKLLYETLCAERDAARVRYRAPYREQIERLGQVVFGPSFRVELDEDLTLLARTVEDRTVPFAGLSGGAKEQLGVISRLACAALVEEQGGVPVILDDALGFSDPRRLEEMGALLAQAGKRSQVILLTCMPDRYRHVGGAQVVRLGPN